MLRRVSVSVPAARAEEARAVMLELFPEGFEEALCAQDVELSAYTDSGGEERLWHAFGPGRSVELPDGWEERWRDFHRPVRVGPVWIGPSWEEPPPEATAIVIDPGRAFGTGGHPSTRLALELLLRVPRGSLLDFGCGSGVLAIAAARLGFEPVLAVDVDPTAVEVTQANARANAVQVRAWSADLTTDELPVTDVAVANISADVVARAATRFRSSWVITGGYLDSDEPGLPGYGHRGRRASGGWAADLHAREVPI